MSTQSLAYVFLRIILGFNFLLHCLVRVFGDYTGFVTKMTHNFQATILPEWTLTIFGYTLPWVEGLIGILLILGFKTLFAIILGNLTMLTLIFGQSLIEGWSAIQIQLIYVLLFFILMHQLHFNRFSLDQGLSRYPIDD
jgi:thiosulfate dehydrogenase (quinone) large subunit